MKAGQCSAMLLIGALLVAGTPLNTTAHAMGARDNSDLSGTIEIKLHAAGPAGKYEPITDTNRETTCTIDAVATITVSAQPSAWLALAETCTIPLQGGGQETDYYFTSPDWENPSDIVPMDKDNHLEATRITIPEAPSIHAGVHSDDGMGHVEGVRSLTFPVKEVEVAILPYTHRVTKEVKNPMEGTKLLPIPKTIEIPADLIGKYGYDDYGKPTSYTGKYASGTRGAPPFSFDDRPGTLEITWDLKSDIQTSEQ